jgi:phytoene desaturase
MKAIVIGAGFGGMAAALRLRAKGYDVSLIDRCAGLGGRAQVFERGGFIHDAGPTVITAPFLFEELFTLFGEKFSAHVQLVPLTPWYRFHFADNTQFDYGGTLDETLAEIARFEPADCDGYRKLLVQSEKIFKVGFVQLSAEPFHQLGTMLKQIPALLRLRSQDTVWKLVSRHLKNPKLRQAFSIQPLLVGGNPFDTTSIYGLIHYLERSHGVHFAMGGTAAITNALGALMARHGVNVQLSATVSQINVVAGAATGVTLDNGTSMEADVVVSNADPAHLYSKMIAPAQQAVSARLKLATAEFSMGLFVLYFGTTRQYPDVAHHTIWLGERYRELLADIFDDKILSEDFSLYLHRPTATDPSFAPTGCDSFYVLCPVPNLKGAIDWAIEGPRLQTRIVAALEKTILPGLGECITSDFYMTPENFRSDYLSAYGAGFSVAPLFRQSAWFRFHNKAEGIKNLYLVGAGTHPGAGLPGVLCSAKVMDALVSPVGTASNKRRQHQEATALQSADQALALKGRSFHLARRWMTSEHAARATRLYGFCRYVDDLADEEPVGDSPCATLALVAEGIRSGSSTIAVVSDAIALMRECRIEAALVLSFIDGIKTDLDTVRVTDEDALLRYCYQVAGTVGAMMCKVLGCHDLEALRHAIDLGIAMQLTNICRDVQADAVAGRRYLPASLVGDVDPQALVHPAPALQANLQAGLEHLLNTADRYYQSGEAGLAHLPFGARFSILLAARAYHAIGTQLRQNRNAYWLGRTVVPRQTKLQLAVQALATAPMRRSFWLLAHQHDASLHSALAPFLMTDASTDCRHV